MVRERITVVWELYRHPDTKQIIAGEPYKAPHAHAFLWRFGRPKIVVILCTDDSTITVDEGREFARALMDGKLVGKRVDLRSVSNVEG